MRYLGHIVPLDGIPVDPERLKAVLEWLPPKDKEMQWTECMCV
jgi:hypothetical protein